MSGNLLETPRAKPRTCIGCSKKDVKSNLLRLALKVTDGTVVVSPDPTMKQQARGAWIHPNPSCIAKAEAHRAFNRAFKQAGNFTSSEIQRWLQSQNGQETGWEI